VWWCGGRCGVVVEKKKKKKDTKKKAVSCLVSQQKKKDTPSGGPLRGLEGGRGRLKQWGFFAIGGGPLRGPSGIVCVVKCCGGAPSLISNKNKTYEVEGRSAA